MNTLHSLAPWWDWLLKTSAQAVVLVLLVLAAQWLFRRKLSPRWRYALWWLVVLRLLLPVSPGSAVSVFNLTRWTRVPARAEAPLPATRAEFAPPQRLATPNAVVPPDTLLTAPATPEDPALRYATTPASAHSPSSPLQTTSTPPAPRAAFVIPWPQVLVWLWAAGAAFLAGHLTLSLLRLRRRLRTATPVSEPAVLELLERCRAQMRVRRCLLVLETAAVKSPALCGLWHPRLLLPPGLIARFTPQELRFVFLHELAHLKRHDIVANWLTTVLQVAHWFNPLVWLAFHRMRADREVACDALALSCAQPEETHAYGQTIIRLLEGFAGPAPMPGLVGILEDSGQMKRRIQMIARFRRPTRWGWLAGVLAVILGVVCLTDAQAPKPRDAAKAKPAPAPVSDAAEPKSAREPLPAPDTARTTAETVLFTVLDAASGRGLPEASLAVGYFYPGSGMDRRELTTDANGQCRIPLPKPPLRGGMNVFVTADWHVPKVVSFRSEDDARGEYTMKLDPATAVGGVVRDEDGQPVSGVTVNLKRPGIQDQAAREHVDFHPRLAAATTDADGRWFLSFIPKTYEEAPLRLTHPDFAVTHRSVGAGKAESTNAVLTIDRGATITGEVRGPNREPVAAAEINELHNFGWRNQTAKTDADGKFTMKGLPKGAVELVVQARGLAPQLKRLDTSGELAPVVFNLEPGRVFRGRVVDEAGQPIAGATAQTDWDNQGLRKVAWETKTDADGRFEWDSAPDETLLFWFEAPGYNWNRGVRLAPGDTEHVIRLTAKNEQRDVVRVRGKVVDSETGQPIEAFRVRFREMMPHDQAPGETRGGTDGHNGEFSFNIGTLCQSPHYMIEVQADGYRPVLSRKLALADGSQSLEFALKKGAGLSGVVVLPDGQPVRGAEVFLLDARRSVYMDQPAQVRKNVGQLLNVSTGVRGEFSFPAQSDAHSIIAVHEQGFAAVRVDDSAGTRMLTLAPWARVEGTLVVGRKPAAHETVALSSLNFRYGDGLRLFPTVSLWLTTETDGQGKFAFEKVPPGECAICHRLGFRKGKMGTIPETQTRPLTVKSGETVSLTLGGRGRPVTGRVVAPGYEKPIDWLNDVQRLELKLPEPSDLVRPNRDDYPDNEAFVAALKAFSERHRAFWLSEKGRQLERSARRYVAVFDTNGFFRIEDVPSGTYTFNIELTAPAASSLGPSGSLPGSGPKIGSLTMDVAVPEMPGGRSDEPFDLGTLTLGVKKALKTGQAAPLFEVNTVDGQPLKLADFRGKFVLLDFWATWCGPCVAELPELKAVYDAFHGDKRFVMLGLSLDHNAAAPRQFAKTNGVRWAQGFLGDWAKTSLPGDYGVEGIPATFLIGPDGSIVAKDLRGPTVKAAVEKALGQPKPEVAAPTGEGKPAAGPRPQLRLSMDVGAVPFGAYDAGLLNSIRQRWDALAVKNDLGGAAAKRVAIAFRSNADGRLSDLKTIESDADDGITRLCRQALLDSSPQQPWPDDMRRLVGQDFREVKLTFTVHSTPVAESPASASGAAVAPADARPAAAASTPFYTRWFKVDSTTLAWALEDWQGNGWTNSPAKSDQRPRSRESGDAANMLANLQRFLAAAGVDLLPPKNVFYNDRLGMLMVRATLRDLEVVESALQALNASPPQVSIEVRYAEVSADDAAGAAFLRLVGLGATATNELPAQPTPLRPGASIPGIESVRTKDRTSSLAAPTNPPPVFAGILKPDQFRTVLRALEQRKGVDVLSSPKVTTLSGRPAQIKVVDVRYVVTDMDNNPGRGMAPQPITEPFEVGPVLDIVPHVAADGVTIGMTIIPSIREFLGYDVEAARQFETGKGQQAPIPLPMFRVRQVSTTANVLDRETVVLSPGAVEVEDKSDAGAAGVPKKRVRKHLLIFVTPTLIDPAGNAIHSEEELAGRP